MLLDITATNNVVVNVISVLARNYIASNLMDTNRLRFKYICVSGIVQGLFYNKQLNLISYRSTKLLQKTKLNNEKQRNTYSTLSKGKFLQEIKGLFSEFYHQLFFFKIVNGKKKL